nr:flagellar hook assembly protein FlgD [uncultured Bacillus sp.]
MSNTIDTSLLLSNYKESKNKTGSGELGKDDFLKLLITQLQNQDPTNPMNDTDFIAQMASFSTLEQMSNINTSINQLVMQDKQSQLISYHQFVGQEVTWHKLNIADDGTPEIIEGSGKVTGIQFKEDEVQFILEDGTKLGPANISEVNQMMTESGMLQASLMIGKTVTYLNTDGEEVTATVNSVSFKNGSASFHLDDENHTTLTASQIIKIS